ncbi:hypothetical protein WN943_024723 [Citrus x changshan-huyou]
MSDMQQLMLNMKLATLHAKYATYHIKFTISRAAKDSRALFLRARHGAGYNANGIVAKPENAAAEDSEDERPDGDTQEHLSIDIDSMTNA